MNLIPKLAVLLSIAFVLKPWEDTMANDFEYIHGPNEPVIGVYQVKHGRNV